MPRSVGSNPPAAFVVGGPAPLTGSDLRTRRRAGPARRKPSWDAAPGRARQRAPPTPRSVSCALLRAVTLSTITPERGKKSQSTLPSGHRPCAAQYTDVLLRHRIGARHAASALRPSSRDGVASTRHTSEPPDAAGADAGRRSRRAVAVREARRPHGRGVLPHTPSEVSPLHAVKRKGSLMTVLVPRRSSASARLASWTSSTASAGFVRAMEWRLGRPTASRASRAL